jgi:hypothetical protein
VELNDVPTPLHDLELRMVGTSLGDFEDCDVSDDVARWGQEVCP